MADEKAQSRVYGEIHFTLDTPAAAKETGN